MKRLAILLAFAFAAIAVAADASGKWTGTVELRDPGTGNPISRAVSAVFEQSGDSITGQIGRRGGTDGEKIDKGRVSGQTVTFEVTSAETASAFKFSLKLSGDRMEGEMRGTVDQGQIAGTITLQREK